MDRNMINRNNEINNIIRNASSEDPPPEMSPLSPRDSASQSRRRFPSELYEKRRIRFPSEPYGNISRIKGMKPRNFIDDTNINSDIINENTINENTINDMKDESEDRINYIKGDLFKDKIPRSYKNYITPISNNISYEKSDGEIKNIVGGGKSKKSRRRKSRLRKSKRKHKQSRKYKRKSKTRRRR